MTPPGTCDWGGCSQPAGCWRYDQDGRRWLPVCEDHAPDYVLAA